MINGRIPVPILDAQKMCNYSPFKLLNCPEKLAFIWVNSPMNGAPPADWFSLWNRSRMRYCTDGAANHIMQYCRKSLMKAPHFIAGDFDSISIEAKEYFVNNHSKFVHVHDQNSTDLTKTLHLITKAIKDGHDPVYSIVLFGGLHGRFDHLFGALNSVIIHRNTDSSSDKNVTHPPVFFIDNENVVTVLEEGVTCVELDAERITRVCGIIPISQRKTIVTTTGFRWNLKNQLLEFGGIVSSSNNIVDEKNLQVITTAPTIFTFELKDRTKIC